MRHRELMEEAVNAIYYHIASLSKRLVSRLEVEPSRGELQSLTEWELLCTRLMIRNSGHDRYGQFAICRMFVSFASWKCTDRLLTFWYCLWEVSFFHCVGQNMPLFSFVSTIGFSLFFFLSLPLWFLFSSLVRRHPESIEISYWELSLTQFLRPGFKLQRRVITCSEPRLAVLILRQSSEYLY